MTKARLRAAAVLVGLVLVAAYLVRGPQGDVSGVEARRLVGAGATLVDVRSPDEFAGGHIDGAVNIPVDELDRRQGELGPKDHPLVLYCRSGRRSARGAGHTAVHNLGGKGRW